MHLAALETSDWMLEVFREIIANPDDWPKDDKSVANELSYTTLPGRKRKSESQFCDSSSRQRPRYSSALEMETRAFVSEEALTPAGEEARTATRDGNRTATKGKSRQAPG